MSYDSSGIPGRCQASGLSTSMLGRRCEWKGRPKTMLGGDKGTYQFFFYIQQSAYPTQVWSRTGIRLARRRVSSATCATWSAFASVASPERESVGRSGAGVTWSNVHPDNGNAGTRSSKTSQSQQRYYQLLQCTPVFIISEGWCLCLNDGMTKSGLTHLLLLIIHTLPHCPLSLHRHRR